MNPATVQEIGRTLSHELSAPYDGCGIKRQNFQVDNLATVAPVIDRYQNGKTAAYELVKPAFAFHDLLLLPVGFDSS
jgi:hypothetical protein